MSLWRYRANRSLMITKASQYRFWVNVPREQSFNPQKYKQLLKQAPGRSADFTRIPISQFEHMWGFVDRESLNAFCDDISEAHSGVDDGATLKR